MDCTINKQKRGMLNEEVPQARERVLKKTSCWDTEQGEPTQSLLHPWRNLKARMCRPLATL